MPLKQRAMERVSDEQSSHAACKRRRHYTHWRACLRCPKQRALARLSDEQSCHATCFVAAIAHVGERACAAQSSALSND